MTRLITRFLPLALLILLFLLAGLAGGPGQSMDLAIMHFMAELRTSVPTLVEVAAALTLLGGAAVTLPLAAIAALALLLRRQSIRACILVATVLGERTLVHALKEWVGRPRPLDGEFDVGSMAFPSGHAANSMTVYLAIAILAGPAAYRRQLVVAAVFFSVAIGLTRIFLGVHWSSDVIGGWALGLTSILLAVAAARRSGALPLETKHEVVGGHGDAVDQDKSA